jgi:hypothetical protein
MKISQLNPLHELALYLIMCVENKVEVCLALIDIVQIIYI